MNNNEKVFTTEWLGRNLIIKTGKLALQANASVLVQYGDTSVLATVVESKTQRENIDFFPLMVEFEERLYAAGIIKGSRWIKREGKPSDDAILTGRMIDRSIRPLFSEDSRKDVQIILTVLSADGINDHDIVSLLASSIVLAISGLPWNGPIGGVRVGRINKQFIFNPTYEQRELSDLDLIVAGTEKKIIMIEAGAFEISEEDILKAIQESKQIIKEVISFINNIKQEIVKHNHQVEVKQNNNEIEEKNEEKERILNIAQFWLEQNIKNILFNKIYYTKGERKAAVTVIKEELDKYLFEQNFDKESRKMAINKLVDKMIEAEVTKAILEDKKRVDGRALNEIRPLKAEAGILPRIHGSGLFQRGETQVLSIVTLAAPGLEQSLEGLEGQSKKRYFHHYNFPPFSVGEASPLRSIGRREIGHGALAEKALQPVLPNKEEFPYTIRVVSEVLGSNGSSSMGSVCGSSLALMDAGVPIKKPVAGIAMGLASNEDMSCWEILTDIQDLEDGKGGMDFKIAGTRDGITAIQLDTKTDGLTEEIIKKTLQRAKEARLQIIDVMSEAITEPKKELSPYAPRIISFKIDPEKIREVIGTGGKVINKIIETTGVTIDIEDDGSIFVTGMDAQKTQEAVNWIHGIVKVFQPGEIYTGKVTRLLDFGAFVEILPGKEGMVHISKIAPYRIGKPSDLLNIGDIITVKVDEIDDQGRINLTMLISQNENLWTNQKGKQENNKFNSPNNKYRKIQRQGFYKK